jgi:hypothetical protein
MTGQCLDRRIDSLEKPPDELAAWQLDRNAKKRVWLKPGRLLQHLITFINDRYYRVKLEAHFLQTDPVIAVFPAHVGIVVVDFEKIEYNVFRLKGKVEKYPPVYAQYFPDRRPHVGKKAILKYIVGSAR